MAQKSVIDTFVAIIGGLLLVSLLLLAGVVTTSRVLGRPFVISLAEQMPAGGLESAGAVAHTATATSTVTVTPAGSPTPSPTPTEERPPTETPRPTRTPLPTLTPGPPTETPIPSPTPFPTPDASDHYWFSRPISSVYTDTVASFYPYGSTGEGQYQLHHGVEFVNPVGTEVRAVAPGTVVEAVHDSEKHLGPRNWDRQRDGPFYGNVVVIEHDVRYNGRTLFTLYGHLDQITVDPGDRVSTGDQIGEVGMTGIALGPHLHLEVRVGANDYESTRNPQLWLVPYEDHGTIAGRVQDAQGNPIDEAELILTRAGEEEVYRYGYSYADGPVNPDDEWGENFLLGDIPAGEWRIAARIDGEIYSREITVREQETTWIWLAPESD